MNDLKLSLYRNNLQVNEDYIMQVSEEIERTLTKKLSQEISRTEKRVPDVLSNVDEFLLSSSLGALWNNSGDFPELRLGKTGVQRG